jgi:hypothetical protein
MNWCGIKFLPAVVTHMTKPLITKKRSTPAAPTLNGPGKTLAEVEKDNCDCRDST